MPSNKQSAKPKSTAKSRSAKPRTTRSTPKKQASKAKAKNTSTRSSRPQTKGKKAAATARRQATKSSRSQSFDYDVCLSFAGEDRSYVHRVARSLRTKGVSVFYDNDDRVALWGEDLYTYLDEIYRKKARFCVMFISEAYGRKLWTNHERQSAQARSFRSNQAYILPARFDDTEIPGLRETVGYFDLRELTPAAFAQLVLGKINKAKGKGSPQAKRTSRPVKKQTPSKQKKASIPGSRTKVGSSDAWVLLDGDFFLSHAVTDHTNGEIEIILAVDNPAQEAMLRALSHQFYQRHEVAYAHGNDAALVDVQSVIMASTAGKPTSNVRLRQNLRNDNAMNITVNGLTADERAEARARQILLDKRPTMGEDDFLLGRFDLERVETGEKVLDAVLPELWSTHQAKPSQYLRLARLQAIFSLKVTNTVEHILDLTLGPISKDGVQVSFEGRRKKIYSNRPATVIKVEGKCPLPKS